MSVYKRGEVWWIEFTIAGKRVRESAKTARKTIAKEYERRRKLEFERAFAGGYPQRNAPSASEALLRRRETI